MSCGDDDKHINALIGHRLWLTFCGTRFACYRVGAPQAERQFKLFHASRLTAVYQEKIGFNFGDQCIEVVGVDLILSSQFDSDMLLFVVISLTISLSLNNDTMLQNDGRAIHLFQKAL